MVGKIMIARKAIQSYPSYVVASHGDKVRIKDADCHVVEVDKDENIYHRGHGCFGIVTDELDRGKRWKWGGGHTPKKICTDVNPCKRKAKRQTHIYYTER
jgi:hypothetical protein